MSSFISPRITYSLPTIGYLKPANEIREKMIEFEVIDWPQNIKVLFVQSHLSKFIPYFSNRTLNQCYCENIIKS